VGKGIGLGLSITYGIVKDYDGEIELHSDETAGTTFKLTFPVALP
jgi:histidine kinase